MKQYDKTEWIPEVTLVSAENLNKVENQLKTLTDKSIELSSQLDNKANNGYVNQQLNLKVNTSTLENEISNINTELTAIQNGKSSKSDITNLQSQINTLVVNGDGTQNLEVVQARNSLFGTNDVLNDRLNNNENAMQKYFNRKYLWEFAIGGTNASNLNINTSQNWRISTPNILLADENITINTNFELYQIGIMLYNSEKTFIEDTGWLTSKYTIPIGSYFRLSMQKKNVFTPITDVHDNELFKALIVESDLTLDSMLTDIENLKSAVNVETPINSVGLSKLFDLELEASPQGHTIINNELWVMYASADDNTSWLGQINRYSLETMEKTTVNFHDLGHCPSINYNKEKDIILLTNGSGNTTIKPKLQFFKNGKIKTDMYRSNEDYLEIPFFTDTKEIGGSGCVACFGENFNIVYMLTGNAPKKLHKVLLGIGANDLSDTIGNDLTKWGTFKTVSDGEINGTAQILKTYDISSITDVFQGITYKNGYIHLLVGYGYAKILKIRLYNDKVKIEETVNIVDYDMYGNPISSEPEGIAFDGEKCIVSLYKSDNKKVVELI